MKVLLVYPRYPITYMGFQYSVPLAGAKASLPPLGLLTVAAMLPRAWERRLVDLNVTALEDGALDWADVVFISAMTVQQDSVNEVIARCRAKGKRIVAGGPHFYHYHAEIAGVDHFVLGEAEDVMGDLCADLETGRAKPIYRANGYPDVSKTPVPEWSLIRLDDYDSMSLQFSRGCPFDCEFCDIIILNGRKPRVKPRAQVHAELKSLHDAGWRRNIFVADDNFYGNKKRSRELLEAIVEWRDAHKRPFVLATQASLNMADDPGLLDLMVRAGFAAVFIGLESVSPASLAECHKVQNLKRSMARSLATIHAHGITVWGGFVIGFDSDTEAIFEAQMSFIEESEIALATVSLLAAIPHTQLYDRLKAEGRLLGRFNGGIVDADGLNFVPRMDRAKLVAGYKRVVGHIYEPEVFHKRARSTIARRIPPALASFPCGKRELGTFIRTLWHLGVRDEARRYFWKLIGFAARKGPIAIGLAITLSLMGYHLRRLSREIVAKPDVAPAELVPAVAAE
jgi:radical SAM superfamily enzyme YgiQ (UPF0313 family)